MVMFITKEFRDCNAEKTNKNEYNVEVILTTFPSIQSYIL